MREKRDDSVQFQSRKAGDEISAPLFVALHLARLSLCEIQCPSWLDPDHLNEILMKEMESESTFSPGLPLFYYEIFQALDDALIPAARICRSVITRIYLTRCQKIRSRKIMDFQFVGSAEVRFCRMIILGCPSTTYDD